MMMYDDISTTEIEVRICKASSADTSLLLLGLKIKAREKLSRTRLTDILTFAYDIRY